MTTESSPRIVRLLPTRFSRDPKAAKTTENTAAALLLAFTVAAILWANSPWADTYWTLLDTHVGFTFGDTPLRMTVKHLVNDGLMTFFFFIVGLEVTREFTIGELTDRSRAAVPVVAAIAGLAIPAVIFLLFNPSGENAQAWGVVISTDTAFLIGALAIIKPKFPARLRIFLLTLAVVDDVGALCRDRAVLLRPHPGRPAGDLGGADRRDRAGAVPAGGAAARPTRCSAFALWIALFMAGIHPTLAGVAVALLIPVFTPERRQVEQAVELIRAFRQSPNSRVRPRRDSWSAGVDFDQRAAADRRSGPTCRSWCCRCSHWSTPGCGSTRDSVIGGAAVAADVGHRRGPCGRQVRRHHRCDVVHAAHRNGRSWRPG